MQLLVKNRFQVHINILFIPSKDYAWTPWRLYYNNKNIRAHECAFELFVFAGSLFAIFCNCFCPVFTIYYVASFTFFFYHITQTRNLQLDCGFFLFLHILWWNPCTANLVTTCRCSWFAFFQFLSIMADVP